MPLPVVVPSGSVATAAAILTRNLTPSCSLSRSLKKMAGAIKLDEAARKTNLAPLLDASGAGWKMVDGGRDAITKYVHLCVTTSRCRCEDVRDTRHNHIWVSYQRPRLLWCKSKNLNITGRISYSSPRNLEAEQRMLSFRTLVKASEDCGRHEAM